MKKKILLITAMMAGASFSHQADATWFQGFPPQGFPPRGFPPQLQLNPGNNAQPNNGGAQGGFNIGNRFSSFEAPQQQFNPGNNTPSHAAGQSNRGRSYQQNSARPSPDANRRVGIPTASNGSFEIKIPEPQMSQTVVVPYREEEVYGLLGKIAEAYSRLFNQTNCNLFANIDNPDNIDAVITIARFITSPVPATIGMYGSVMEQANPQLLELAQAVNFIDSGSIKTLGTIVSSWIPYGMIAKILNHPRLTISDEIRERFQPCSFIDSKEFYSDGAENFLGNLMIVNELLKAGLINKLDIRVPSTEVGDTLFKYIKLNDKVKAAYLDGNFDVSKAIASLQMARNLKSLTLDGTFLDNEELFFTFINNSKITSLSLKNVGYNSRYGFINHEQLIGLAEKMLQGCATRISVELSAQRYDELTPDEVKQLAFDVRFQYRNWKGRLTFQGEEISLKSSGWGSF